MPWTEKDVKTSREDAKALAARAIEMKAVKVVLLDVSGASDMFTHMLVMTATSRRHAQSLADDLAHLSKQRGLSKIGLEGYQDGKWILLDLADVLVHVFLAEVRDFYNLEALWGDAQPVTIE